MVGGWGWSRRRIQIVSPPSPSSSTHPKILGLSVTRGPRDRDLRSTSDSGRLVFHPSQVGARSTPFYL